jgi:hypothetical protein
LSTAADKNQPWAQYYSLYGSYCLVRALVRNQDEVAGLQLLEQVIFRLRALIQISEQQKQPQVQSESPQIPVLVTHEPLAHLLADCIGLQADILGRNRDIVSFLVNHNSISVPGSARSSIDIINNPGASYASSNSLTRNLSNPSLMIGITSDGVDSGVNTPNIIKNDSTMSFMSAVTHTSGSRMNLSVHSSPVPPIHMYRSRMEQSIRSYHEAEGLYKQLFGDHSVRRGEMFIALGDICRVLCR